MVRVQKYLAECGLASRRHAETLIEDARVTINGRAAKLGDCVDPGKDIVACDGELLGKETKVYVLLNKPRGVITSLKDTHGRKTVTDCIEGVRARVFPVGRLDMDVEGALLLTNDGELAHRLTHPKYEIPKVYLALVQGVVTLEDAAWLAKGVVIEDSITAPAKVAILHARLGATLIRLTLHEGRKHEVKRMCEAIGHPVCDLRRTSVARLSVKDLRPGEWRYLSLHEIAALRRLTGL